MPVPKTAMYEDNFAYGRKGQVRPCRQGWVTRPEFIAQLPSDSTNNNFGLGISATNTAHETAALVWRQKIHFVNRLYHRAFAGSQLGDGKWGTRKARGGEHRAF